MTSRQRQPGVRLLWPLAALLSVAGVVLLALGVVGTAARPSTDLVGVARGQEVAVPEDGMSVWSRSAQTRAETVCTVDDTVLLRPVEDFTLRVADEDFHEVARSEPTLGGVVGPLVCDTEDAVYAGPYGPATSPTGLRGGTGLTLGLLLLPLGLVCAVLALLARRRPPVPEAGPDPSAYTLDPRSAPPRGPFAPPSGAPPTGAPAASPPPTTPPSGPRYLHPPAPVSTGHDAPEGAPGKDAPSGPRYDLPPPS